MTLTLDQLEALLTKFGFRHLSTCFYDDGSVVTEFCCDSVSPDDLRRLSILGFSVKYKGSRFRYVVAVKSVSHD